MSYSLDAIYKTSSWAIAKNSMALAALQQKAATGLNIIRVSDDPVSSNQILSLQDNSRNKQQYMARLDESLSVLDLSASVIQSVSGELSRARASLTATLSGTTSRDLRGTLADDLNNAIEQLVALCNTDRMGQYLFGGNNSQVPPYAVERDAYGKIIRVNYQGSYQEQKIEVVKGMELSALMVGDQLFRLDTPSTPQFYGATGAAAGSGTSSVRGDVYLQVDGTPGNYRLSIDGGLSWTDVTAPADNIPVLHSQTGQVLYVNATGITQTGVEPIRATGTYDLFNILISARDLLNNNQNLTEAQVVEMISASVVDMQNVESKLVRAFPIVGGRIQAMTTLRDSIEAIKVNTDEEISRLYDADVTQIAIDLARYDVLYQMSLNIAAKMFKMSLLDFMQ